MKKPYDKPEIKTILFTQQDVICVSGPFRSFSILKTGGGSDGIKWRDIDF